MFTWIESHSNLSTSPKTRKLMSLMNIDLVDAIGHIHLFWHFVNSHAPDGDITGFDPVVIAISSGIEEKRAEEWIEALLNASKKKDGPGFLEQTEDGRLIIHDWMSYTGKQIKKREADAERKRNQRSKGYPEDIHGTKQVPTEPDRPHQPKQPYQQQVRPLKNGTKAVAKVLGNFDYLLTGSQSQKDKLIDLFVAHGFEERRVRAALIQSQGKQNPPGYFCKLLGDPKWGFSDEAMDEAKKDQIREDNQQRSGCKSLKEIIDQNQRNES